MYLLDTIQDFLCVLGMKPRIRNHHFFHCTIFGPTTITKDLCKASTYIDSRLVVTDVGNNFGRSDDDMF